MFMPLQFTVLKQSSGNLFECAVGIIIVVFGDIRVYERINGHHLKTCDMPTRHLCSMVDLLRTCEKCQFIQDDVSGGENCVILS